MLALAGCGEGSVTTAAFRPVDPFGVRVTGSVSGPHSGRLVAHRDGAGASFVAAKPFAPGEQVTVSGGGRRFSLTVARFAPEPPPGPPPPAKEDSMRVLTCHTVRGVRVYTSQGNAQRLPNDRHLADGPPMSFEATRRLRKDIHSRRETRR